VRLGDCCTDYYEYCAECVRVRVRACQPASLPAAPASDACTPTTGFNSFSAHLLFLIFLEIAFLLATLHALPPPMPVGRSVGRSSQPHDGRADHHHDHHGGAAVQ
jgi:hypothetical protein